MVILLLIYVNIEEIINIGTFDFNAYTENCNYV